MTTVQGLTLWGEIHSSGLWCMLRPLFKCGTCGANRVFCFGLKLSTQCVVLEVSCEYPCADQFLPMTSPELPGRSYKVIFHWLLPVQDLEARGRGHPVNQGQIPQALSLEQLSKRPREF